MAASAGSTPSCWLRWRPEWRGADPRSAAARLDRLRQDRQRLHRGIPAQAGIGDALAIGQLGGVVLARGELLRAGLQVAFDHQPEHAARAASDLAGDVARHFELALMLLAAVGMAAIDHQRRRQTRGLEVLAGGGHAGGVVIGRLATAQDHVAIPVALGLHDGDLAILVDREEVMPARGGLDGVGGDADIAVGAVLEADRGGQARGQLAVDLALGGARTDGAPGNQVADVLRRDHIEEFAACRQAQAVDLDEQLAGDAQAFVDAVGLIEVRVVDQALPADGGAGLLEVHPHDDLERVGIARTHLLEATGVVDGSGRIVDGARADHHQQAVVLAGHDVVDAAAGVGNEPFGRRAADREEPDQVFGRREHGDVLDALVVGLAGLVDGVRIPGLAGGGGLGGHRGLLPGVLDMNEGGSVRRGKKKPPEVRRFFVIPVLSFQVRSGLSAAGGAGEIPKIAKKGSIAAGHISQSNTNSQMGFKTRQGRGRAQAVPPTVRPSMRRVGWPTPTGTLWPSLPQVPTPVSRLMSLPIMLTRVRASGPLPTRVAPLTG